MDELVRPHRDALRALRPLTLRTGMRTPPSLLDGRPAMMRRPS
jgi:hypothetical protein